MPTLLAKPFHIAVESGNLSQVRAQIGKVNINTKDYDDRTAVFVAAAEGHTEILTLLLTCNPDVNIPTVSTLTMISDYLRCIFLSYLFTTIPSFLHLPA